MKDKAILRLKDIQRATARRTRCLLEHHEPTEGIGVRDDHR